MDELHMMNEILRQAKLEKTVDSIENQVTECCKAIKMQRKDKKIIITGSGDSYFIGLAVKPFFEKQCRDSKIEVLSSMDFAKYGLYKADLHTTVIAISISGNVVRTIECVKKSQKNGAFVIGITNNKKSSLSEIAERPIFLALNTEPTWTCGTLTYVGSMYALFRIAIELADSDDTEKLYLANELKDTLAKIDEVIKLSRVVCKEAARNMRIINNIPPVYVLGAGPNLATAKYGAAKFMEICSTCAIGQECEEFCHGEFWVIDRANLIFMALPTGSSFDRGHEVYDALRTFGCDLFVVSDNKDLCNIAKFAVQMPQCNEMYSPLLYAIPFQLVSYYYSYEKGLNPDTRDHTDKFRKDCSRILTRGKIMDL